MGEAGRRMFEEGSGAYARLADRYLKHHEAQQPKDAGRQQREKPAEDHDAEMTAFCVASGTERVTVVTGAVNGSEGSDETPFLDTTSVTVAPSGSAACIDELADVKELEYAVPSASEPVTTNVHSVSAVPAGKTAVAVGVEKVTVMLGFRGSGARGEAEAAGDEADGEPEGGGCVHSGPTMQKPTARGGLDRNGNGAALVGLQV